MFLNNEKSKIDKFYCIQSEEKDGSIFNLYFINNYKILL